MKILSVFFVLCLAAAWGAMAQITDESAMSYPGHESTWVALRQGLPHNYVDCVYVDSRGFVWMGTAGGGLVRYDGYDFVQFSIWECARRISGNCVTSVCEDSWGRLWVGTDCGIDVIDLSETVSICHDDINADCDMLLGAVNDMCIDALGRVWVSSSDAIKCIELDEKGNVSSVYTQDFAPQGELNSQCVSDIDGNGTVYICHGGSVAVLSCDEHGISRPKAIIPIGSHVNVFDMIKHAGDLWVATDVGLYRCDLAKNEVKSEYRQNHGRHSIPHNWVKALAVGHDGHLLAGTLNGLIVYDQASDRFSKLDIHAEGKSATLSGGFVNCLACGDDNMWIGTEGAGAVLLTPRAPKIKYYKFGSGQPGAPDKPVNAIYEDQSQTLWVGVVEGGLSYRRPRSGDFVTLDTGNSPLPHNSVSAIAGDRNGGIWVGTWGKGLIVLDRDNPAKVLRRPKLVVKDNEERHMIGSLQYDPYNDGMWIGTIKGLFYCDIATGEIIRPIDDSDGVSGAIGSCIDQQGHLWIGSFGGLYDIDLASRRGDRWSYRRLDRKLDQPDSEVCDHITSLALTRSGTLLVGSSTYGAYIRRIDESGKEKFENFTTADGLPHNSVTGILEDYQGKIWVATYDGIGCYDPMSKSWHTVDVLSPSQSSQFYLNAYQFTFDGHLLFGSTDGMVDIDTNALEDSDNGYNVCFTGAMIDGTPMSLLEYDARAKKLSYSENDKTLQVSFSALDYAHNPSYTYYYRLRGFDRDWVKLPQNRHDVTYTNLSPGHYELEVAYIPGSMTDMRHSSLLSIDVRPMFYNTWWFRLLCLLALGLSVVWFYRKRTACLMTQRYELESKVAERTSKIMEQKQALEQRNMQVQELTVDRLSFFTNITHEFRTPITLILGPLNQAIKQTADPKVSRDLKMVQRNAHYLLALVNQLMDFRKLESGKLEIHRRPGNFAQFLDDTVETFAQLAQDRNIRLDTISTVPQADINFDKEAMRKLLHNFITNALKYTPEGGKITVRAAVLSENCYPSLGEGCRKLYISVTDTGDGLSPDDLDRVFDRFYQGTSNIKYPSSIGSSGIGLYLCKSIIEGYGGELIAKNGHGCGAVFRVILPIMSDVLPDNESEMVQPLAEMSGQEASEQITVLVVEDNHDMLYYIRDILESHFTVLLAYNGMEALDVLAKEKVNLIVSDLMMPVMDGMELLRHVKGNLATSHIPVVLLTAKSSEMAQLESYSQGADAFVTKPFNPELLLSRIHNIIKNQRRYQHGLAVSYKVDKPEGEETRDQKFMRQVMDVVRANYRNSFFEVGDFAEQLGVSRSFLNKKLQALIGQSASQLVKNYRMKQAYDKIVANRKSRSYTISEIAYDVGFNDSKYFSKCFSKEYGVTPSELLNDQL